MTQPPPDRFDDEEEEEEFDDAWRGGWTFQSESYDKAQPLDNGLPGFRLQGLREIEGTYAGRLEDGIDAVFGETAKGPVTLYLYGPDPHTRWWRHWFYKIRERLTGEPYPSIVIASGPARINLEDETEDGDDVVFSGTFTADGKWHMHSEVDHEDDRDSDPGS